MKHSKLLFIIFCLCLDVSVSGQETCGSATPLSIGVSIFGDNTASLADFDYSGQTSCPATSYNSAVWYSFTVPPGVSSMNLNYNTVSIGPSATLTIVDNCLSESSNSFLWSECNANSISGSSASICNLTPSTTYYIQIASNTSDEGAFNLSVVINPSSPANDICATATLAFEDGIAHCGDWQTMPGAPPNACPDPEADGICMPDNTPGVWYTFMTPDPLPYSLITISPLGSDFNLFYTFTDCTDLTFIHCGGFIFLVPLPGATYYLLIEDAVSADIFTSVEDSDCQSAIEDMNTGNGTGEDDFGNLSCSIGTDLVPCMNDATDWFVYTVGCTPADITISIEPWDPIPNTQLIDGGISVAGPDCGPLLAQYDPNGLGYVCSAIIGQEELILNDVPAGTTFNIAVGTNDNLIGYYNIFVEEDGGGSGGFNDLCSGAIVINDGLNPDLNNLCSSDDEPVQDCTTFGQSTVWYEYTPPPGLVDINIELNSTGIGNTSIAAYNLCDGDLLETVCGSSLDLLCHEGTIFIQIGSTGDSEGTFELTITSSTANSGPGIEAFPLLICSGTSTNLILTVADGLSGIITVTESVNNDPNVTGLTTTTFPISNSVLLDDILVNTGTTVSNAVYTVVVTTPGFTCPSLPIEIEIPVNPQFITENQVVTICLPDTPSFQAADFITGGTLPYQSYNWLWMGTSLISSTDILSNYPTTSSGFIRLDIIDANGCPASAILDLVILQEIFPEITTNQFVACQGDPPSLSFQVNIPTGQQIITSSWEILDDFSTPVINGFPQGNDQYIIETNSLPPGTYSISAEVEDVNGCIGETAEFLFVIFPSVAGTIILNQIDCMTDLTFVFYALDGTDIYGNGPDGNGDGIPDIFDTNNDGIPDFESITWIDPDQNSYPTGELTYVPPINGVYTIEITTNDGCEFTLESELVVLVNGSPIAINGPTEVCEGEEITLFISMGFGNNIIWYDENGIIATNTINIVVQPENATNQYVFEVSDIFQCTQRDTIEITVFENPIFTITGAMSLCPGESTILEIPNASDTWSFEWQSQDGTVLFSTADTIEISKPDSYLVIVTNENNCSDSLSFEISEKEELFFEILGSNICDSTTSELDAGPGYDAYTWTNIAGDLIESTQVITIDEAGIYIVNVQKGQCVGIDSIEIMSFESPIVEVIDSVFICNEMEGSMDTSIDFNTLLLNSVSGEWSSLDLVPFDLNDLQNVGFSQVSEGSYSFVFTSNTAVFPCVDQSDTLVISVSNCACTTISMIDTALCNSIELFNLDNTLANGTNNGTWSLVSGQQNISVNNNNEVDFTSADAGIFLFEYLLSNVPYPHCQTSDTVQINLSTSPILEIEESIIVCNVASPLAPNTIDLDDYILDGLGVWQEPMIPGLTFDPNNLDFTNIEPGEYLITIVTSSAILPCIDITKTISVQVMDCNCPIIDLQDPIDYCSDNAEINLNQYLGLSANGTWSEAPNNPENNTLLDSIVDLTDRNAGTYTFIYELINQVDGCEILDTISINLFNPPFISLYPDTTACNFTNGSVSSIFDLTSLVIIGNGIWTDQNGNIVPDPSQVDFLNEPIGSILTFTFTSNDAIIPCSNVASNINIEIVDCSCPVLDIENSLNLCNDMATLNLNQYIGDSEPGAWTEIIGNPQMDLLSNDMIDLTLQPAGEYQYLYTLIETIADCPESDTLTIQLSAPPLFPSLQDTLVCNTNDNGNSTLLDLYSLTENTAGEWTDEFGVEITDGQILDFENEEISATFIFTFTTTSAVLPCSNVSGSITVSVKDCSCIDPLFIDPPDLCNIENEMLDLNDLLITDVPGVWEFIGGPLGSANNLSQSIFNADNILPGIYKVRFIISDSSNTNCQHIWPLEMKVVAQETAELNPAVEICTTNEDGQSTSIDLYQQIIAGNLNGEWQDDDGNTIEDPTNLDFLDVPIGKYFYSYMIANDAPCKSQSYTVEINAINCRNIIDKEVEIYFPNIFSPNGDGVNDLFFPISNTKGLIINKMIIYDRWGNKMFQLNDEIIGTPESGWDGLMGGERVVNGVYVYYVEIELLDGSMEVRSGDLMVM